MLQRMKIVLVSHGYPPHALAGVEVYTRWFARALARTDEVRVFSTRSLPDVEDLALVDESIDGVDVTFLANHFRDYDPVKEVRHDEIADRFDAFLARERPDLVHVQHLIKLSTTLLDVCEARGIPTVMTLHDYWFLCPVITLIRRDLRVCDRAGEIAACTECEMATAYLNREEAGTYYIAGMLRAMMKPEKWAALEHIYAGDFSPVYDTDDALGPALSALRIGLIRRFMRDRLDVATVLASPSRFLKSTFERNGLGHRGIHHMPNGIETDALQDIPRPADPPPLRVLYLGTINKHKGVHVLVDAANRLADLPIEVHIHGTGPDEKYERYLRDLAGNPAIRFGGRYDRDDLPALLGAAHVVVMPSIWYENHPIVIREAFAAGIPVIAPDLGAMPEAIQNGRDGLLYPHGDAEALAALLERLLAEPGLLSSLRGGIEPVLGVDEHVEAYRALYATATAAAEASPAAIEPRRIVLVGRAEPANAFARVLGDALIAGGRCPRPIVSWFAPEDGPLAAPLRDLAGRLGLGDALRPLASLDETGPVDLVIDLDAGGVPDDLAAHGAPLLTGAPSLDEIDAALG